MDFRISSFESRIGNRDFPLKITRMEPQNPCHMHSHEFSELVIVYKGEGVHYSGSGEAVPVSAGNIFLVPQGKFYHRYGDINNLCLINILFENRLLPMPLLDVFTMPGFNILFNSRTESREEDALKMFSISSEELSELLPLADKLETQLDQREPGYQFISISLFMQIVHFLAKAVVGRMDTAKSPGLSMSRAIGYLHRHFVEKEISIESLAASLNMSMSSLLRHFRRQNGCSPKEYLLKLRIRCACEMLLGGDFSISEIATRSGFEDSNYFSRQFRKSTGLSPREFRDISSRIAKS